MITTRVIPQATASATTQELLVECTEQTCRPFCINGIQPSASVAFSVGSVSTVNGYAIAPVTATVTVVTPNSTGCGCAHTQIFTEQFDVAFTATTGNTITLTAGDADIVEPANPKCCKAQAVKLTTTLTVTIA